MRALRKLEPGAGLELVDVPEPSPGQGEVKIRVLRAGLCGTDLHIEGWDDWAAANVPTPLTLGHEFFGEVVELGEDVTHFEVGQKVSGEGHLVCGLCRNCKAGRRHLCINTVGIGVNRDGAFADFVVIPASNAWPQPDDLDPDIGALFDPLGNAVHTALSFPLEGEDVLITGAGPIGVMATAITRHVGARFVVVTDLSEPRLELAAPRGRRPGDQPGDDLAGRGHGRARDDRGLRHRPGDVRCPGGSAPTMMATMNHGGRIALLGLPHAAYDVDWGRVITHMITLKGIYGREMYETWYKMTAMLQTSEVLRDRVRSVITHRFPAEQWQEAFARGTFGRVRQGHSDWY